MGEIAPLRGGFAFKSSEYVRSGVPIVRISNILSDGNIGADFAYYSKQDNDGAYTLSDGAVLLAMSGATTGKVSILHANKAQKYYQNQRVGYFVPTTTCDYGFISVVVRSRYFSAQLDSVMVAGAQPNVSARAIDSFVFSIPTSQGEQNLITLHQRKQNCIMFRIFLRKLLQKMTIAWEQRKLSELIIEYKETVDSNCTLPVLTSSKTDGVILQEEHFGRVQNHDITGYNVLPRNYCTYRNRSDGVDFTFNINRCCDMGIISKFYPVFYGNNNDIFFISMVLNFSDEVVHEIAYTCTGTGQKVLSFLDLQKMNIKVPSYDEQKKISMYFETIDNLITLHQRKQNSLSAYKNISLSSSSILQKTTAWEQCKLGDIGKTYGGLSGKSKEDFGHGDARFVTYMNVFSNPVGDPAMTEAIELDSRQNEVKKGDIFFTTSSETPEEVGMSCVWMQNTPNTYLNSFCFGYRPIVELDLYYLAYVLRSNTVRHKFIFLAQGISRYNISKNKVMEMLILVPNKGEQVLLGAFFKNLDNLITLHQRGEKHIGEK